jgi:hypothetical protein
MFSLRQEDGKVIAQSVLITDNGYCRLADLRLVARKIQDYFPKAKISILTLPERYPLLRKELGEFEFIICAQKLSPRRYRLARGLLSLRKKDFDHILLFSLDLTPLAAALFLFKSRIILYNQWGQWYSLRLKKASEIFRVSYRKQKSRFSFKNLLKRAGLFLVLLESDAGVFNQSILVVDDGAVSSHLIYTVRQIKENLPFVELAVLTLSERQEIEGEFGGIKIIRPDKFLIKRYRLARQMLKLRKNNYDYVILPALDITPILASVILMESRVLLLNRWHQWWSLRLKPPRDYLLVVPLFTVSIIYKIIISTYLLINIFWIFLLRALNILKTNFSSKGEQ